MRIRLLRAALRNLEEEAAYIAAQDPVAAQQVVQRVLVAVQSLAKQPGLGRRERVADRRELVVLKTRYVVPYRVRGETIEILRVFHSTQRLSGQWLAPSFDRLAR